MTVYVFLKSCKKKKKMWHVKTVTERKLPILLSSCHNHLVKLSLFKKKLQTIRAIHLRCICPEKTGIPQSTVMGLTGIYIHINIFLYKFKIIHNGLKLLLS